MSNLNDLDIELLNKCFNTMNRNDMFLPISYDKIKNNKELLEECTYCVDDAYHLVGVDSNYEPNEYGIKIYHLLEKLNHRIYELEDEKTLN